MTIEDFTAEVKQQILDYLPPGFMNARVEVYNTIKNSHKVHGVCIRLQGQNIAPVFYMENYYCNEYEAVTPDILQNIASDIYPYYKDYLDGKEPNAIERELLNFKIDNYEEIKTLLRPIIVNLRYYSELLNSFNYKVLNDMAVLLIIDIPSDKFRFGPSCIKITKDLEKLWDKSFEELYDDAISNMRKEDYVLRDVACKLLGKKEVNFLNKPSVKDKKTLFELTSKHNIYGSNGLLCTSVMNKIGLLFPEGFYIIPSSIHECLIVSKEVSNCPNVLKDQLTSINLNGELITNDDVLSFDIYQYDEECNELQAC